MTSCQTFKKRQVPTKVWLISCKGPHQQTHQTKQPYNTDAFKRHTSHQTNYVHSKKEGKHPESIQSKYHLMQDNVWESDKNTRKHHKQESQAASLTQQMTSRLRETDTTVRQTQAQITNYIHKESTALERSVRKLLEGLNMFHGTNLTLKSGVDQET